MLVTTQSQSKSRQPRPRRSISMPSNFTSNSEPIGSSPLENLLDSLLDELALETHLNLAEHPAHKLIDLPEHHIFNSASKFQQIVAAVEHVCFICWHAWWHMMSQHTIE